MQRVLGKSYIPKNPGIAPLSLINSSASLSKYSVVIPSLISPAIIPRVLETSKALSLISSISSLFFVILIIISVILESFLLVFLFP